MAFTAKWTIKRGNNRIWEVQLGGGAAEANRDQISLNVDVSTLAKGDVLILLDDLRQKIWAGPWPPL